MLATTELAGSESLDDILDETDQLARVINASIMTARSNAAVPPK